MRFTIALAALGAFLLGLAHAQQYAGDFINNSLPGVPGSEIAYWKIHDTKNSNLTLINYINHGSNGQRLVPSKIQRAIVIIHGLNRDPGTYMANMLSAMSQITTDPNINTDTVAIVAPYFPDGDDKGYGYPWVNGLKPAQGSITNALVWSGSQWSAGGNNQYPWTSSKNISSYTVLDQMIQYFDNVTMFPNMNQIVIAGHSLGGQTVQRYAAIGQPGATRSPVTYWTANPDSYVWMSIDRPLSTTSCAIYDNYREGYTNFSVYPMTYGLSLVNSGRPNILANYNSKQIAYARGTQDLGDDASTCAAETTGSNRNERFFNFIKAFPVSCPDPEGTNCDTVDLINAGHDGGAMMASLAGQARLFKDNFYGNHSRAYDFGYPREQTGDDPYPNPALNSSTRSYNNNTYAGNMTYWGCWSDQTSRTLTNMTYQSETANTIELCTATCAQNPNNTIAGMEDGDQCFCGSSLGYEATEVIDSSCASNCTGNSTEICGGANRLSLFSNGTPKINSAPGTPEVIDGSFYYTACYTEATNGARALASKGTSGSFMTLEYCGKFCSGYQYFGTEYGQECYCGNSFSPGANITSDNDCSMLCAADSTEFCGAGSRLTVYQNTSYVAPTGSSTTSTAAATSTSGSTSTGVSCPASNATTVTSNGKNFTIECGIDHSGGDLTSLSVSNFQGCIDACAQNSQCVDVSLSGSACYLKSTLGAAVSNSGISGAKLITSSSSSTASSSTSTATGTASSSTSSGSATGSVTSTSASTSSSASASATAVANCPASNNTQVVSNGVTFLIECGIDHQGGDLTSTSTSTFQGCIDFCAQNPSCVDVSLSGSACYAKSSVGAAVSNGVWGARVISGSSSSSSSSSSTVSSTASSSASSVSGTSSSSSVSASTTLSSSVSTSSVTASGSSTSASSVSSTSSTSTSSSASASATPVSCPASNGMTVVSNGESFLIECNTDHAGGDLTSLSVSSFQQCIDACAQNSACVDVSLSGSACYLKSTVGATVSNGCWGARLIVASSSSSSVSTASSTATTLSTSTLSSTTVSTSSAVSTTSSSASSTGSSSTVSSSTATSSSASSSTLSSSTVSSSSASSSPASSSSISSTASSTSLTSSSSTFSTVTSTSSAPSSSSLATTSSASSSSVVSSTSSTSSTASPTPSAVSCPGSNSTIYTVNSANFMIECGIDHAGGDMSSLSVNSFAACISACSTTTGCVDVSLSGSACYLKKTLGSAVYNGVFGARLLTSTSSSSVASATSSPTSSSSAPATTSSDESSATAVDVASDTSSADSTLSSSSSSSVDTFTTSSSASASTSTSSDAGSGITSSSSDVVPTSTSSSDSSSVPSSTSTDSDTVSSTASSSATVLTTSSSSVQSSTSTGTVSSVTSSSLSVAPTPTSSSASSVSTSTSTSVTSILSTVSSSSSVTPTPTSSSASSSALSSSTKSTTVSSSLKSSSTLSTSTKASTTSSKSSSTLSASTKSSSTASSTTSSQKATSTAICPTYNKQTYTDSNSVAYTVHCPGSNNGTVIGSSSSTVNLAQCMEACDGLSGCLAANFHTQVNMCYFVGTLGSNVNNATYNCAVKN